ncbi:MAG TPA: D-hexose-6-phosphate mutarotase, partial [Halothiobacillaceae bacterium]|nr:D-hexose-6-phosphate mutarotase [Halothiobacillaceae bacterium]
MVENVFARFAIIPFGATLFEYQPHRRPPVLWQSPQARFDGSKA